MAPARTADAFEIITVRFALRAVFNTHQWHIIAFQHINVFNLSIIAEIPLDFFAPICDNIILT
jgi:hypothetical protein